MRRFVSLATAAALLAGTVAIPAAEARPGYRHYGQQRHYGAHRAYRPRHYRHRRGNAGAAVAAGIAGALIGGALAAQQRRAYYGHGYGAYGPQPGYYGY